MSPKLHPAIGDSRGVKRRHICVSQTLFGASVPMTWAATWIALSGDGHNSSTGHGEGSLTYLLDADAPCRAAWHALLLAPTWWEHRNGLSNCTLQCQTQHSAYFGSLPTVHHIGVWGYQSSTWLKGLVTFYLKRYKFAQRSWICADSLVNGLEVCRMDIRHCYAFWNKDVCFTSHSIQRKNKKTQQSLHISCQLKVFRHTCNSKVCNVSPRSSFSLVDYFIFSHEVMRIFIHLH